jgi:hypothetical protein
MDNTINSMATAIHQLIDETIVEPRRPPSTQSQ